MIWSISWKNVWRNRKRSLVVIGAVMLGTIAGVFTDALMVGWCNQRIRSAIYTEASHIKLFNPDYLLNEELKYTVPNGAKVISTLETDTDVKAFSNRVKVMAMAGTSRGNTAVMLQGVNLEREKQVSNVWQLIVPKGGGYLSEGEKNQVVISDKTAELLRIKNYGLTTESFDSLQKQEVPQPVIEKLKAMGGQRFKTEKLFKKALASTLSNKEEKRYSSIILSTARHYRLNSKIVFTFNGINGQLLNQSFKVCGVYKTTNTMFDQMNAFVLQDDLSSLAGFRATDFHEMAIILKDHVDLGQFQQKIKKELPGLSVMTWRDLVPDAGMLDDFMDIYYYVIMGIILFALAFGIINTMLMAILERTKEIGMLMAIGMNRRRVFKMIMLETVFLTMVGAVAGMVGAIILIAITKHTGLNFSSVAEGFEAMGWASLVYPDIEVSLFFGITLMVIATGILSSITPARKALKLNPVEAIRTE